MKEKKKINNFFVQGSILAMAGIICRLIGFVYRVPMNNSLGEGVTYYSKAYDVYNIALIVSSYGMPLAVSKLIATRVALKEYKNERRVFKAALSFAIIMGVMTSLIVFFGADSFAKLLFNMPECALPLKVLSPTIFICAIMGTLRGYFQGNGNMIPTSVSQIIEQIFNAVISVVATITFMKIYNNQSYGAAGGTLGTTIGAFAGLVCLLIIFLVTNKDRKIRIKDDKSDNVISYKEIYRLIMITTIPIILSQTVYNLNGIIDSAVFCHMNRDANNGKVLAPYTLYILLVSIPVAIATALSNTVSPVIVREKVKGNMKGMRVKINQAIKYNMLIAIPASVGLGVLSDNIMKLLFPSREDVNIAAKLLMIGALAVVFFALSTTTTAILQSVDLMKLPIINSAISLVSHLVFIVIFLKNGMGIYSLAVGNVIFALGVCILNWRSISKHIEYKQEIKKTFMIPTICAIIMGIITYMISSGLMYVFHSNLLATIISIIVAIIVYLILMIKLGAINKNEFNKIPKVQYIYKIFLKLHIIK